MRRTILTAAAIAAVAASASTALRSAAPGGSLTIDALVAIKHPSRPAFSPDGRRIAFLWDVGGVQNVWIVDAAGGAPVALTRFDTGLIDTLFWNGGGNALAFSRAGRLWQVDPKSAEPQQLWTGGESIAGAAPSPDGRRIAFEREGDLWVRNTTGGPEGTADTDT